MPGGFGASSRNMLEFLNSIRNPRRSRWAAVVVLAVLAVRALVPAGFMLAPVDGRVSYVLCEPDVLGSLQAHAHHHHHAGQDHTTHAGAAHADSTCPYAQSAGPAPLRALPVLAGSTIMVARVAPESLYQVSLPSGPIRQHLPRGPPILA